MNRPMTCWNPLHRAAHWLGLASCLVALSLTGGCDQLNAPSSTGGAGSSSSASSAKPQPAKAPPGSLELVFPYGSEKKHWLDEVTQAFNNAKHQTADGKHIFVRAIPMGSGEAISEILGGHVQAHLVSPASAAFIKLGNAESETKTGGPLVGKTQDLVLSPVVIAMWKPMAEALGWGQKPIGWADILALVKNPKGWGAYDYPQWGQFKFGHTHPDYSNSGLISLFAETYAATGKTRGLTLEDIAKPETGAFLHDIESAVVHYGRSTGFFGRKLFGNGPEYLSAAVLYENMVIESYDKQKHPNLPFPIVAVYPKEGTFWSDHPVGVVQREWVTDAHKAAAEKYIEYLLERPQQERAMAFGFRPADPLVPVTTPIDTAHGVDPDEPKTTLEVPSVEVMAAIKNLWREQKKHANIVLVMDTSGSMKGRPLRNAKEGAKELVGLLGDQDYLSFLTFSSRTVWLTRGETLAASRQKIESDIDSLLANGGTALYDAVAEGHEFLMKNAQPDKISAVVVLTDGADRNSKLKLGSLLRRIQYQNESRTVRVFTIGYGKGANADELDRIANETQGASYAGSTENIRKVFREISTFF